jgi:4-aminobutyrate aminotransferase-like enzyme
MSVPLMINAFRPETAETLDPVTRQLIARRDRVLGPSYRLFYKHPVHFVRAEKVWLYGPTGEQYLDVYNNVPSVGHCHPHVVAAIARQAAILNTHTRYLFDSVLTYAEKLLATFPPELSNVMFACTGSESVDLAMRVARTFTGGSGFVVTDNAYHGLTSAVAALSPSLGENVPLGEHVRTVPAPDVYRNPGGDIGQVLANDVDRAIHDLNRRGIKFAGLIADTIFSSDGIFAEPAGFLRATREVVRRAGGVFIADEVQPGFARTGEHMWGFLRHRIDPDIVVLGKPMGNGMPISGIVARPDVLEEFGRTARYFNTFGGNPVSCAAALAVLEVIENEDLQANARKVGSYLLGGLHKLAGRYPSIGDVRGVGLFIGVELIEVGSERKPDAAAASRLVNGLRERRILISASGPQGNILKLRPPLPFSEANADQLLGAMDEVLSGKEMR